MERHRTQQQSDLTVVTKTKELCGYVMAATQKSPKQFRFSYVGRMQSLVLSALENILRANEVLIGSAHPFENQKVRYTYQKEALTDLKVLVYIAELSLAQNCILARHYEQMARIATDCRNLLGAWINSDKRRLSPQGAA